MRSTTTPNKTTSREPNRTLNYLTEALKMIAAGLRLGLSGRQWTASLLIGLLLLPVFSLPVGAAASGGNIIESDESRALEAVNEPQNLWETAWNGLSVRYEEWETARRPGNESAAMATGDGDQTKKPKQIQSPEEKSDAGAGEITDESDVAGVKTANRESGEKDSGKIAIAEESDSSKETPSALHAGKTDIESNAVEPESNYSNNEKASENSLPTALPSPSPTPLPYVRGVPPGIFYGDRTDFDALNQAHRDRDPVDPPGEPGPGEPDGPPEIWTDSLWRSQFTADNNLGKLAGRERTGLSNFNFGIPAASIPGRGISASVDIAYNSQLWTKDGPAAGSAFVYNVDRNWLAPGFNLSYGYLESYGTAGYAITTPDGNRHQLLYKGSDPYGYFSYYESADTDFIYMGSSNVPALGGNHEAWARFADGSMVMYDYDDFNDGRKYAKIIYDRNGNYLTIDYLPGNHQGRISKITDTMNREIHFHYDTNPDVTKKKLVTISVQGIHGSDRRQTIRFYYGEVPFAPTNKFQGSVSVFGEETVPTTVNVLKYVYFPGTKTGYRYDYSNYFGMINEVTELAGMQVSDPTSATATGTVTVDGQVVNRTRYNYPNTMVEIPPMKLSEVPRYNKVTSEWQGRDTTLPYETYYDVDEDTTAKERTVTMTAPNGTVTETKSHLKPAEMVNGAYTVYYDDGLTKETSILDANDHVLQKQIFTWEPGTSLGGRTNPRLQKVQTINEVGLSTETVYDSYDEFHNPGVVTEYGFADAGGVRPELSRTEMSYMRDGWLDVRLIHLPREIKKVVNNVVVSKTVYEYDDSSNLPTGTYIYTTTMPPNVTGRPQVFHHSYYANPAFNHNLWIGNVLVPLYFPQKYYKGNVTKITSYADATLETDPNASQTVFKYDVLGNPVEASLNCCNVKTWEYDDTNKYTYPLSETKGDGVQLKSSAVHDYNTGLVTSTKDDSNDLTTYYEYEMDTLRPSKVIYPNGGYVQTDYSDKLAASSSSLVPGYVRTTTTLNANNLVQSYSYYNGRGAVIRRATQVPGGQWSASAMEYDSFGRVKKSYNPFYATTQTGAIPGGTASMEIVSYDALGRLTAFKLQDNTIVNNYYNEVAVTYTDPDGFPRIGIASRTKDQANKEKRQIMDARGRVARVDEPDTVTGGLGTIASPTQPTHYYYDGNDNLSKVLQIDGSIRQERRFKYDSLSRLVAERQVEAIPTLNDAGQPDAPAPDKWTKVLKYDVHGLLKDGWDARGVNTHFSYDGLNRVKKIEYSDGTPTVKYQYDQTRTGFYNKGALTRVETEPVAATQSDTLPTATELDYDKMGRVTQHRQSIGAQTYNLAYGYNLTGELTSETYPSGKVIATAYDASGRLASIADQSRTYLNNLQYQGVANSMSAMTLGNGTKQEFILNPRLQIQEQSLKKGEDVLQKYQYGYGQINSDTLDTTKNNGQLAQIESFIGNQKQFTQKFDYDAVGRLGETREYRGDNGNLAYKQHFDYDRFGNQYHKAQNNPTAEQPPSVVLTPIEATDIDKATNRLSTTTGLSYDNAGNVVADNKFRATSFSYDANGRVVKATKANTPDAISVYDSAGQRVAERINNVWKFCIYDVSGKAVADYGGVQLVEEGGVKYPFQDWLGSTRAITSNAGFVQVRQDFTAFGEEIGVDVGQRTAAQGFGAANNLTQKYAQTERDTASGVDNTWFRKLENKAGRWTSPDPYNGSINTNDPQSFNRYTYVNNDPVNFVDPSGLNLQFPGWWTWERWGAEYSGNDHFGWDNGISFYGGDFGGLLDGTPLLPGIHTTGHWSEGHWIIDGFLVMHSTVSGIGNSSGDGNGGQSETPEPKTDCGNLADKIGDLTELYKDYNAAKVLIGGTLADWTSEYFSMTKQTVSGFKDQFTASGQDSDVYRHVTFGASSILLDGFATAVIIDDSRQLIQRFTASPKRAGEALSAISGNSAGLAVGGLIAARIKDYISADELKTKIFDTICVKVETVR